LDVRYIAEHHENLQHVLLFFTAPEAPTGLEMTAEVINEGGTSLVIRCDNHPSPSLELPTAVSPGSKAVKEASGHFEIKMPTEFGPLINGNHEPSVSLLMDASKLSSSMPTNFVCTSCSLPLLHSSDIRQYRDLPSEHWEELVDAWMCHADQKLHEHVMKNARGFLPEKGQALVGGSYILFEESAVAKNNLHPADSSKVSIIIIFVCFACGSGE
jgi:hypothetical protein